jgi:predicted nucleic acid-binding protein
MIPTLLVKAEVVDIQRRSSPLPKRVVADSNVLYVLNYDFTVLAAAGCRVPRPYQTQHYPAWWKRAVQTGIEISTTASCLAELAHIVERTEMENLWRTDPNRPELDGLHPGQDFSPNFTKVVRYHYHGQLQSIRGSVETTLASARKNVNVLPRIGQDEEALNRAIQVWVKSAADFADAGLVAHAKGAGIVNVVSDDADLMTFEGITVYTANRNAIDAARNAGKLLT